MSCRRVAILPITPCLIVIFCSGCDNSMQAREVCSIKLRDIRDTFNIWLPPHTYSESDSDKDFPLRKKNISGDIGGMAESLSTQKADTIICTSIVLEYSVVLDSKGRCVTFEPDDLWKSHFHGAWYDDGSSSWRLSSSAFHHDNGKIGHSLYCYQHANVLCPWS